MIPDNSSANSTKFEIPDKTSEVRSRRKFRKEALTYFREYCSKTGIHGVDYIVEEKRIICERIFWIVCFAASVAACIYMISEIYFKWLQSPVLVTFGTRKTPIYDVPFPAITICPKIKIDVLNKNCFNTSNFMYKKRHNIPITSDEMKYAAYMHVMCDEVISDADWKTIDVDDFYRFMIECEPKRTIKIVFQNRFFKYDFNDLFKRSFTEEGLCYSFNRLRIDQIYTEMVATHTEDEVDFNQSTWTPEFGYEDDAGIHTYPRRALLANIKNSLTIYLFEDKRNRDFICDPVMQGYTVTLHIPCRPASTREEFFFVPFNTAALAPITAKITLTSEKVKAYVPKKRDCYFPSERRLKYFQEYTLMNCQFECLADYLYQQCGCVRFYMPRNKTTPVCGPANSGCTNDVDIHTKLSSLKRKLNEEKHGETQEAYDDCDCLRMCNDVTYTTNAAPLKVDHRKIVTWLRNQNIIDDETSENPNIFSTVIVLYLQSYDLETTERNELYGPSDFLSNFGGLLGLFTGFSMLSCVEIIYFLTLRIIANLKIFGRWTGAAE